MKLSNFKDVEKVVKALSRIDDAIVQVKEFSKAAEKQDSGGAEGILEGGYYCHLSPHSDGSGSTVNMTGCYVATEMASATMKVLVSKRKDLVEWLRANGVDVDV